MGEQGNTPSERAPHARQTGISVLWPMQKQSILSPTIEESPSPRVIKARKLGRGNKTTSTIADDFTKKAYPNSADARPGGVVHGSSYTTNNGRPEIVKNRLMDDTGSIISGTVYSSGRRKTETPSSSSLRSPIRQNTSLSMPRLDTDSGSSSQTGDTTTGRVTSSPSIARKPPLSWLNSSSEVVTPRHGYDSGTSHSKQNTPGSGQVRMSGMNSNDVATNETESTHTEVKGQTAVSDRGSPLQSLPFHHSSYDVASSNGGLPKSITEPQMGEEDHSVSARSVDANFVLSSIRDKTNRDSKSYTRGPADQWRSLVASSKSSNELLAKSARERRLKRGSDPTLSRTSREEASILAQSKPATPERKRRFVQMTSEPGGMPTMVRPERKCVSEETPQPTSLTPRARAKGPSLGKFGPNTTPYGHGSQRSASKPMPGAIKAMAALFDNAVRESPGASATATTAPSRRARHGPGESTSFPRRDVVDERRTRPNRSRENPAPTESPADLDDEHPRRNKETETFVAKDRSPAAPKGPRGDRAAPQQSAIEESRAKSLRDILRPARMFSSCSSAGKEPRTSRDKPADVDRTQTQPPRLGTMVPHQEEPEVGHFVRLSSSASASAQSLHPSAEGVVSAPLDGAGAGYASGNNSLLHAQIRSLQRQLERRDEAALQLRRQLETQAHMDVGTLCEQLRLARRECAMWRKRAEAAEKRVAVLQRIGAKFRALEDGDGVRVLGGDEDEFELEEEGCTTRARRGCELRRSTLQRTAELWQAARETA